MKTSMNDLRQMFGYALNRRCNAKWCCADFHRDHHSISEQTTSQANVQNDCCITSTTKTEELADL